jgi:nucleoside-diphosphate-sugar epimerase
MMAVQTILGANGVIGRELSRHLRPYTDRVRQVSRSPRRIDPTDELAPADLLDAAATAEAVKGSSVTYLVAGLKYDTKVWQEQWPKVMRHAMDACNRHGSALVFFDNVYAYGKVRGAMTEDTPYNPSSRKGEVRARIATMLMDEVKRGALAGMIVRSADFYGPGAVLSMTHGSPNASKRRRPRSGSAIPRRSIPSPSRPTRAGRWRCSGNTAGAYGQVWHALTSHEPITGEQYVRMACELSRRPYRLQRAPRWMLSLMGLFVPVIRENMEMLYQFERDYVFDSSKVERALGLTPTTYREGIAATLRDAGIAGA